MANEQVKPHTERLWKAVQEWVEAEGGKLAVVGSVQVIQMPGALPLNWTLGVQCTGRKPTFAKGEPT